MQARIGSRTLYAWTLLIVVFAVRRAEAGCPCNADVTNNGSIQLTDLAAISDCARGVTCAACVNSCDVNCDGVVDWKDFGAAWCDVGDQAADCCAEPNGACTPGNPGLYGPCIVTQEDACVSGTNPGGPNGDPADDGTYHGSNTVCSPSGEPVIIPAASAWGLMILALSVLVGGTLALRPRRHMGH